LRDQNQAEAIASKVDGMFENSPDETKTQTEREFALNFTRQIGNLSLILNSILGAVFFTILLLTGNTMAQAVRERIPELAVLKTIGFSSRSILTLVLTEAVLLLVLGGGIGLALSGVVVDIVRARIGNTVPLAPL